MRRLVLILWSTSSLTALSGPVSADDMVWPQVGGWGQAWSSSSGQTPTPPSTPSPSRPAAKPVPQSFAQVTGSAKTPPPSFKQDDSDRPIKMDADEVSDDRDLGIVTARGSVEAFQGRRHLMADTVTYNIKQDFVTASGNVVLVEPTGEVTRADYMELTSDFATGIAREIRYLAADKSRMRAQSATRSGDNRMDFDKATYTACEPCKDHPERVPLWQIDAERVTHNQEEKTVEYHDVWLDVKGVPVAYVPYLSTPDPTVKRRSGFLSPSFSGSSSVGQSLTTPYFWDMGPHEDITFFPRFMLSQLTRGNPGAGADTVDDAIFERLNLGAQHRWVGENGATEDFGSFTENPKTAAYRGMVNAKGIFDFNSDWRLGYSIQRMSDDTYARVYNYTIPGDRPWLNSRVYGEGFWDKDYAVVEALSFQGITNSSTSSQGIYTPGNDAATQAPWVMPHMSYTHISSPGTLGDGDRWTIKSDQLTYARMSGVSASRLSNSATWSLPYRDRLGQDWKLSSSVRADEYHSDDLAPYGSSFTGRAVPQMAINWSYPFVNDSGSHPQTISPLGMIAISPNGGNPHRLPNEDSILYELDESNILRPNRTSGLDYVENGLRGGYGLKWSEYTSHGSVSTQIGQGWRAHTDAAYSAMTDDYKTSFSDFLGRFSFDPSSNFVFTDRIKLDKNNLSAKRNEAKITVGPKALQIGVSFYDFAKSDQEAAALYGRHEQIYYNLYSEISEYWSFTASYQDDLIALGGPIGWRTSLTYNDDCYAFVGNITRNFTYQNDYLTGITFSVNFVLKTLGQLPFTLLSE